MSATTASDSSGVEYFFDCTSPGGHDSGWQDSPTYTDTGLTAATEYSYRVRVRARDKSAAQTATAWSATASATTTTTNTPRGTLPFAPRPKTIAYSGHFVVGFWAPPHLIEVWGGMSAANFPFCNFFSDFFTAFTSACRQGRPSVPWSACKLLALSGLLPVRPPWRGRDGGRRHGAPGSGEEF